MAVTTLVIGGGLSGLFVAVQLHARGHAVRLIEARDRLGGRILSPVVEHASSRARFDLGPAWFWQGQPRIARLISALKLQVFEQYAQGALSYEDERRRVHRDVGFSSMEGSLRIVGGMGALVRGLAAQLPAEHRSTEVLATGVELVQGGLCTRLVGPGDRRESVVSDNVVLAIPPRVAAATFDFGGHVSDDALAAMRAIPTWMGGHAKVVAVYERPFWREAGLSGDAMSRVGPLAEIHDASPAAGGPFALFGFVGTPVERRRDDADALRQASVEQLGRIFGPPATQPLRVLLQDWALDLRTASELDHSPLREHPDYGLPPVLQELCGGRLLLASTEAAPQFGGYLEGALEAAQRVLAILDG